MKARRHCGLLLRMSLKNISIKVLALAMGLFWLCAFNPGSQVQAKTPHETFLITDAPTATQISLWSSFPGKRSYLFRIEDPSSSDLEPIRSLQGADRIEIEINRFPGEDSLPVWKKLSAQGVGLVGYLAGLPTWDEIKRLNQAGLTRATFVVQALPGPEQAALLGKLRAKVSLTLATGSFPRYLDKPSLMAIPASIPLLFVTDYWPSYVHMDLLNQTPHSKKLRVQGMMPPEDTLDYLRHIKKLDEIQVDIDFDPSPAEWTRLAGLPVTWNSREHFPSADSLTEFSKITTLKKLVLDQDTPLSADDLARLQDSPLTVEWIHAAPMEGRRW
ncbi:hypothetical protein WDW37_01275 [Bdellovibrionota bacterium FG-1]